MPWESAPTRKKPVANQNGVKTRSMTRAENSSSLLFLTGQLTESEKAEAYKKESSTWKSQNAFVSVKRDSVPKSANIIGSHVIYKRKPDGSAKARIVPWGHRDSDKDYLRKDMPCMNIDTFRLVLSISAQNRWKVAEMDITAAFLQACGLSRIVYVRPPSEEGTPNNLWRLTAAAYGLADSGRLWYNTSDSTLVDSFGLTRSRLDKTLYFRKCEKGQLVFVMTCQVDNYIYSGSLPEMRRFEEQLQSRFQVGELKHSDFEVYGSEISQSDEYVVTLRQDNKMNGLDLATIELSDRKDGNVSATPSELSIFRSLIGYMLFLGRVSHPFLLFVCSDMAKKTQKLQKHHLKTLNSYISFIKKTKPELVYRPGCITSSCVLEVYSDASLPPKGETRSRSGWLIFKRHGNVLHPISWQSRHIRRVVTSSSSAETLAAVSSLDTAVFLMNLLSELGICSTISCTTDSAAFFANATTAKEPEEKRLKIDLAQVRELFENGDVSMIRWFPGQYIIADALTKFNKATISLLMNVLRTGAYDAHPDSKVRFSAKGEVRMISNVLPE